MADRTTLLLAFDELLQPSRFTDYGPNGLQVEGQKSIQRIISGVTASRALIEAAIGEQAQAIFVHHGLFWRGQDGRLTGWLRERVALLMAHNINLFAYHLPLDAHPELGNNAQLGRLLGTRVLGHFGDQALGCWGELPDGGCSLAQLTKNVQQQLGRQAVVVGDSQRVIRRLGWCTGGAQSFFQAAIDAGVDAFLTGEISEPQAHLAREAGVAFLACGHHATERLGAPAVAAHVAEQCGISHRFVDIDNPA